MSANPMKRSCTSTLRIIRSAQKSGKISPFHHRARGFCHDSTPFLLSVDVAGTPVVVLHAALCLAEPMHCWGTKLSHANPPAPSARESPHPLLVSPTSPSVPSVSKILRIPKHPLRCHLLQCPRPLGVPGSSTPPGTFVPIAAVRIAAGGGWATSVPMV